MSETEFVKWSGVENRGEWIDGEVALLHEAEADHSEIAAFLAHLIRGFVDEFDLGEVLVHPYQVRLARQRRRRLPDLFFVSSARLSLIERMQCNGAPDLVVEIISPDSQSRDRREKFLEYEQAGVAEYWLVDRPSRSFEAYALEKDGEFALIKAVDGKIFSSVLNGLFVREEWVWQLKFPNVAPLLRAMSSNRKKRIGTRRVRGSGNRAQHERSN
jgi:Uma2 family endonuclease